MVLLAAAAITVAPPSSADETRPNIILILADDLGVGDLGCYGQTKIQTPHLDRLAAEGMRFTRCYAGANVCAPSRCALLTGLHTGHAAFRDNVYGQYLSPQDLTIAEVLKAAGYETACFGKWGMGNEGTPGHPNRQGFDEFFGVLDHIHGHFYYPYFLWRNEMRYPLPGNEGKRRGQYSQDEFFREAAAFLRRDRDGNRPFFMYLTPTTPHVELVVPEDSLRPYRGRFQETPLADFRRGYIGADEPYATYAGMISRLDAQVGELMGVLKERGLDGDTIVFFTSDNGPAGDHFLRVTDFFQSKGLLRGNKGWSYEGGIRAPMVVRWPGHIEAGSTSNHPCALWDIMPTLADLAGTRPPEHIDGLSFTPTLLGKGRQAEHAFFYWELNSGTGPTQRAIRMGRWKAVQPAREKPWELYDLERDPSETTDVAGQHPDIMQTIAAHAAAAHSEARVYPPVRRQPGIEDFVR